MHWIDPDSLKPLKAEVARFLFNPKGDADGMILSNGLEAHFPPHLSREVLSAIQTGDAVTLYGVKPRGSETLSCVAIETVKGGRIYDRGPPDKKEKKHSGKEARNGHDANVESAEVEDTVERLLHGPKGEVRGVLLAGASIVRFPPHIADHLRRLLTPGAAIAVRGDARTVHGAIVIEAKALGRAKASLKPFPKKPHD